MQPQNLNDNINININKALPQISNQIIYGSQPDSEYNFKKIFSYFVNLFFFFNLKKLNFPITSKRHKLRT